MSACFFQSFDELSQAFDELKRTRRLHPAAEQRLASLLEDIFPDAYPKSEPGEMPGGRPDLAFYFGSGLYAVFEIFATVSQVAQDLRHLEQSNAQARIAILTDPSLDGGRIYDEYFGKRPRDPFPWVKLSEILVSENEDLAKETLKQHIEEAFASEKMPTEFTVDVGLQLGRLNLGDTSSKDFGRNEFTENLGFTRNLVEPLSHITRYVVFIAITRESIAEQDTRVLSAAREMLQLENWYDRHADPNQPPKYRPFRIFEVPTSRRSAGNALMWEDFGPPPDRKLVLSRLAITGTADVVYASAHEFVDILHDGTPIFRISAILAQCWSLSGLIAQLHQNIGYTGRTHLCIAMINTNGSHLGWFAQQWYEPYESAYWIDASSNDWSCHSRNLIFCETVDLAQMKPREQPNFIEYFAEAISLAYNHDTPRCFERGTPRLSERYLK